MTYARRLDHAGPLLNRLRVRLPLLADLCAIVAALHLEDGVADDERSDRDVDEAELLAEEVRALDLLRERTLALEQVLERLLLLLRGLRLHEPLEVGNDRLRDEVDPDARICTVVWVGGEEVGLVVGVGLFEELAENEGLVESLALVLDSRDQSLRVDI